MTDDEFWDTDFRSLGNRMEGFFEMENRRERSGWERVRWQSALILQMFAKKGSKIKPKDLAVFPWEEEAKTIPKGIVLTPEEQRRKFEKADKRMRERWQKTG